MFAALFFLIENPLQLQFWGKDKVKMHRQNCETNPGKGLRGSEHVHQLPPFTSQPLSKFCFKRQWTLTYLLKWSSQSAIFQLWSNNREKRAEQYSVITPTIKQKNWFSSRQITNLHLNSPIARKHYGDKMLILSNIYAKGHGQLQYFNFADLCPFV